MIAICQRERLIFVQAEIGQNVIGAWCQGSDFLNDFCPGGGIRGLELAAKNGHLLLAMPAAL